MRSRGIRAVFFGVLFVLGGFIASRIEFSTDITNFMPDGDRAELATLARQLARSDLARTNILTVGIAADGPKGTTGGRDRRNDDRVVAATTELAKAIEGHPEIAWLRTGPGQDTMEAAWEIYFPRRFHFASVDPETEIPRLVSDDALAEAARRARDELAQPTGSIFKKMIPADPVGLFRRFAERLAAQEGPLKVHDGVFLTSDGQGVIFLGTKSSAFASKPQGELLAAIDEAFAQVAAGFAAGFAAEVASELRKGTAGDLGEDPARGSGPDPGLVLTLERSGANRFAVDAERSIRRDVRWIGLLSMLGIAVLFYAYFRSVGRFALAMMPAVAGVAAATAAGLAVFGQLDGLTIAFGASLIGVAIDYPIHLLNHDALSRDSRAETVRRLGPTLSVGALTTMASFAGLSLTAFPGFQEIGFFAMTGVGVALLTTLFVVPAFLGGATEAPRLSHSTAGSLGAMVRGLDGRRKVLLAVPVLCLGFAAWALPGLTWEDDLSKLSNIDPALQEEDNRVRSRVSQFDTGRFAIATGADEAEVLAVNDKLYAKLLEAKSASALEDFRSLADLVRSPDLQRRNIEAFRKDSTLVARTDAAFTSAGFRTGALGEFNDWFAADPLPPLTIDDLRASPLGDLLATLLVDLDTKVAAVTQLRGIRDVDALGRAIEAVPGARLFDQKRFVNRLYAEFRGATFRQIFVGCALVLFVLLIRYRALRPALAALLPSLLVALLVLSIAALRGESVNLLHVVSLIMVMGMGVDYGVFLVDSSDDPRGFDATMLSLLLSCLTTVLVFGTLALSSHPALSVIGRTTGLGVLLSLLIAPVTLVALGEGD